MTAAQLTAASGPTYRYALYPASGGTPVRSAPALFFFHGKGERGDDLALLERHGPPRLLAAGRSFPFTVIAPQCPADRDWRTEPAPALADFVAAACARHDVDPARVYLTGISMGGFATWAVAQEDPTRFAAILPICGGGDVTRAGRLRDLPIWAFHGARDAVIPPARSEEMVAAIRAAGGTPRLTIYPEAAHDSWTDTYASDATYAWLLAQRRQST
jgi:predicted peptidase